MASGGVLRTCSFCPTLSSQDMIIRQPSLTAATTLPNSNPKYFNSVMITATQRNHSTDQRKINTMVGTEHQAMKIPRSLNFSGEKPSTPVLDTINYPIHMKNLSIGELESLADEVREEIVYTVSKTGGHLSSSLGVTELTIALHHVFNTPDDKNCASN